MSNVRRLNLEAMLIHKESGRPHGRSRRCHGCQLEVGPTSSRRWILNSLIPAGTTSRYECAVCGNVFEIRTTWHMVVLLAGLTVLLGGLPELLEQSLFTQLVVLAVMCYMAYAISTDVWDRIKNPKWSDSDADA
jgi:hypothetical protein